MGDIPKQSKQTLKHAHSKSFKEKQLEAEMLTVEKNRSTGKRGSMAVTMPEGVKGAVEQLTEANSVRPTGRKEKRQAGCEESDDDDEDSDGEVGLLHQVIPDLPTIEPTAAFPRLTSAMKTLQTELMVLHRELEEVDCKVHLVDSDIFNWEVELKGPDGSPYQGGTFWFSLNFPPDYPAKMPRIRCMTQIFHCNIDRSGTVCLGPFDENGLSPTALVPRVLGGGDSMGNFARTQLRVSIINAKGLRNADFGGVSDPYCTCQIPGKSWSLFQTAVINDMLNPVWNEEHVINDYTQGDPLMFEVW